jgi:hypothetical protein
MDYKTVNSDCQFLPLVVSTGSTTVLGARPVLSTVGGFDRLNHRTWPVLSTVGGFDRLNHRTWPVLSTAGGFDRLNHRTWPVLSTVGGFDRLNHRSLLLASKL